MSDTQTENLLPKWHWIGVLIIFPIVSTLLSLLLLNKHILGTTTDDFYTLFWIIITGWYGLQFYIIHRLLKASNLSLSHIGYAYNKKQSVLFIGAYLIFAFFLVWLIEFALNSAQIDREALNSMSDLSDITPKNTLNRVIFVFMGLLAGITEEVVYRGFAIKMLENSGLNKWIAVVISAIPFVFQHGLKSIDQFWWFLGWGIILGIMFNLRKRLDINIIIHWLVILAGLIAILQVLP